MDWLQAQKSLTTQLLPLYGDREAAIITDWVLENLSGWKKIDRILHRSEPLPDQTLSTLRRYSQELLTHRPVQYVLNEAWFAGMKLYVDENVLIPRPETEELVDWVLESIPPAPGIGTIPAGAPTILDVGTGSGCIPITPAKRLPTAQIHACDLSTKALEVARRNANSQNTPINFHHLDFLNPGSWNDLPTITCLVSNPPTSPSTKSRRWRPTSRNLNPARPCSFQTTTPFSFTAPSANSPSGKCHAAARSSSRPTKKWANRSSASSALPALAT
ncbi:N5-glutamine methyltransferase family protein [Puia sp. P3]|uniref:N5-glutamine methyltransferase family protein n=1 Tax=Puia sp. P3 TaxID=3423952 RepID=UPI003D66A1F3